MLPAKCILVMKFTTSTRKYIIRSRHVSEILKWNILYVFSVSCLTVSGGIDEEAQIAVRIMGSDGNPQDSTGDVIFTYRVCKVCVNRPGAGSIYSAEKAHKV